MEALDAVAQEGGPLLAGLGDRPRRQIDDRRLAAKLLTKRDPGGRPPYGFQRNSDELMEPDVEALPTVNRIYALSAAGLTDRWVAEQVGLPLFTIRVSRAKDADIRQALLDRFGGSAAVGRKAAPAPLYGIHRDVWSALAIAVTYTLQGG